jgi:hypothetical protein
MLLPTSSPPNLFQGELVLPLSLILLKRRDKHLKVTEVNMRRGSGTSVKISYR